MYLNKSNRGIGWYSFVNKNGKGEKLEKGEYINFIFKKGTEPEDEKLEGDLFFIDSYGNKRLVLPFVDEYNNVKQVKFRLMDELHKEEPKEDNSNMGGYASESGQSIDLSPDEFPFY